MKAIMQELDYDMDDDDIQFLNELNYYNKMKRITCYAMKMHVFFSLIDF